MIVIGNLEKLTSKKDKSISNSKKLALTKKITATVGSTVTLRDILCDNSTKLAKLSVYKIVMMIFFLDFNN